MRTAAIIAATVLCLLAAFGIGAKWDVLLFPLGCAFGWISFVLKD